MNVEHQGRVVVLGLSLLAVLATRCDVGTAPNVDPPQSDAASKEAWRRSMTSASMPKPGCFRATYPSTTWQEYPCTPTTVGPLVPVHHSAGPAPQLVGYDLDFVSQIIQPHVIPAPAIVWSEGSFPVTKNLTTVNDVCNGLVPGCIARGQGHFGLQMNTNTFFTKTCQGSADPNCVGWAQFVFTTDSSANGGFPGVFMQYWLINFGQNCPTGGSVTWKSFNNKNAQGKDQWDCFTPFAPVGFAPMLSITDLDQVVLTGTTGTTNTVFLFSPPNTLIANAGLDDAVGLNSGDWTETEFNLFGAGGGSEADLNFSANLTVQTLTYPSFNPNITIATQCDGTSFTGETNNRYATNCWTVPNGIQFIEGPPNIPPFPLALPFNPYGWIDWVDGHPGQPGPGTMLPFFAVADTTQVLRLLGTAVSNSTSSFDSVGVSLLAGVAAGTADLLIGDDVAEGGPTANTPNAAVIVNHGTTTVHGALSVGNGLAHGHGVTPIGTNVDPPDLRAYDALDATLFSLHVNSTPASVTNVDVAAALNNTTHVTTTNLVGDVPEAPLALVWNRFTKTLFVVDVQSEAVRLLTIDPVQGQARELWRTRGMNNGVPSAAYLSVSFQGEIVIALSEKDPGHDSEILVVDATGAPQLSASTKSDLAGSPQALTAGISVPVLSTPAPVDYVGTQVILIQRAEMKPGMCGAPWLAANATETLAHTVRACGK